MKIIFNTKYPNNVASINYKYAFAKNKNIEFNNYKNYHKYDIALFMTYPQDLEDLKKAKKINPKIKSAIVDPRGSIVENYIKYIDFFIIDSIEMHDFFAKYRKPMYMFFEYPNFDNFKKKHINKKKIIIGYHGNKVHLTAMYPKISTALTLLSEKYNLELWAIYNINNLGLWDFALPSKIKIRHIQWEQNIYEKELKKVDIGISPACMPLQKRLKNKSTISKFFLDSDDDYLIKFKMPSNPGRIIVFQKLGIPVVADFIPSYSQTISHGKNGFLAYSSGGWFECLEKLILSHELRNQFAIDAFKNFKKYYDYEIQNKNFNKFLKNIINYKSSNKRIVIDLETNFNNFKLNFLSFYETIRRLKQRIKRN